MSAKALASVVITVGKKPTASNKHIHRAIHKLIFAAHVGRDVSIRLLIIT